MPEVTLREMEIDRRQKECVESIHVSILAPLTRRIMSNIHWAGLLAAGSKRTSSRLPVLPSDSGFSPETEVMSGSPVTVARLRRIRTDFPILPELPYQATQ